MLTPDLARLREGVRTHRSSSYDRSGGNRDFRTIAPGATLELLDVEGPGCVTHIWVTFASPDRERRRNIVLRAYWDGAERPSVEVPVGDFFGIGNCVEAEYWSLPLAATPRWGRGLNCWFPMPFRSGARITVENESDVVCPAFYFYVDHERWAEPREDLGAFHAAWNRERPRALDHSGAERFLAFAGTNLGDDDNYLLCDTEGRGHYVGTVLNIANDEGGWYGEGDDMFVIDGEPWPPRLHGTGTEDYFGTAWSPATAFSGPFLGQPVAERPDWKGFSSVFRFHLGDPVVFERSLRASVEHGHANGRADDLSSTAYWYQQPVAGPWRPLPPAARRRPPYAPDVLDALDEATAGLARLFDDTLVASMLAGEEVGFTEVMRTMPLDFAADEAISARSGEPIRAALRNTGLA